jgi:hypothetical protein
MTAMTAEANDDLWALELYGTLFTPLMARNALKSNVTWTSYPFVPPTSASGFFVDLLSGYKWYETNDNCVRHLHALPDYEGVFALGAYPSYGQMSKRHFRAHLGSLSFNYEAYVWSAGKNEGKKLAVIEEFLAEELRFVVVARESELLRRLHQSVRGRVAPIVKKGSVQLEFIAEPRLNLLRRQYANGKELTLTVMPFVEVGNLPRGLLPYLTPLRSKGGSKGVEWQAQYCAWDQQLCFREGTQVYKNISTGISRSLLESIGFFERNDLASMS